MQQFEGERTFSLPVEQVWARLSDAAFLVRCVPEATVHGEPERDRARYAVKPGFSFARGSMDVTMEIVEREDPGAVKFRLTSKGIGSSNVVETALRMSPYGAS